MKFPIKDFFSKYDQIRSSLQVWSHLLKKSVMENFIFLVQCHTETIQLICCENQQTGFCVIGLFALNKLKKFGKTFGKTTILDRMNFWYFFI